MVHRYSADMPVMAATYKDGKLNWHESDARMPHIIETFDSLNEFLSEAKRLHNPATTRLKSETVLKVRDGVKHDRVPSILEIVSEAIKASPELRDVFTFTPQFDVAGDYVDVGRFVEGEPECMVSHPMQVRNAVSPVITLVSTADSNAGGEWETRGIIATALGMALGRLGYATEMWADNYGEGTRTCQYQRIKVKSTDDALNPARLLFGFGDRAMLSQLAYGCFDGFPKVGFPKFSAWQVDRGEARPRSKALESLYPPGTVFITGNLSPGAGPAKMAACITSQLRAAGVFK